MLPCRPGANEVPLTCQRAGGSAILLIKWQPWPTSSTFFLTRPWQGFLWVLLFVPVFNITCVFLISPFSPHIFIPKGGWARAKSAPRNRAGIAVFNGSVLSDSFVDWSSPGSFCPWGFSSKNMVLGCHFLLQGIFLT